MEEKKYRLAENIENLKRAYGESNLELALAIGLNSPNSISNYTSGLRDPKKEIRCKIAKHYHITEEELMYSDFSKLEFDFTKFDNAEKLNDMALQFFPVICTDKALQDPHYKKAYDAHMRAIELMKKGRHFNADMDICMDEYGKAYDEKEGPEALANLLWWLLIMEVSIKKQQLIEGTQDLKEKKITVMELVKEYHLDDCSEDSISNDTEEETEEMEDAIYQLIGELKQFTEYVPLADYFIALRYMFGCVSNDLSEAMNIAIGEEMMLLQVRFENKYAIRYLRVGKK